MLLVQRQPGWLGNQPQGDCCSVPPVQQAASICPARQGLPCPTCACPTWVRVCLETSRSTESEPTRFSLSQVPPHGKIWLYPLGESNRSHGRSGDTGSQAPEVCPQAGELGSCHYTSVVLRVGPGGPNKPGPATWS